MPYIFLISIWGGFFPLISIIGSQFYLHHFGFGLTMIAFIIFPFLVFQMEGIQKRLKNSYLIKLFVVVFNYIDLHIILVFFYDNEFLNNKLDGEV